MSCVGLSCGFSSSPLRVTDVSSALMGQAEPAGFDLRTTAVTLNHLQLIRQFVDQTCASHVIVCEDDVYLRRTIKQDIPAIVRKFDESELDVLLLGYLWPQRETAAGYQFHDYDDELWGAQMYMLSRKQATYLVETYTLAWALAHAPTRPFSPDWIITKDGRRARLSPMVAVEEGAVNTTHSGQVEFHRRCAEAQYDPTLFV